MPNSTRRLSQRSKTLEELSLKYLNFPSAKLEGEIEFHNLKIEDAVAELFKLSMPDLEFILNHYESSVQSDDEGCGIVFEK